MTSESPIKSMGETQEQNQKTADLTSSSTDNKNQSRQHVSQNSPSKSSTGNTNSPTKSRNRRRNDAKRRSGGYKKQQATNNTDQSEKPNQQQESKSHHVDPKDVSESTDDQGSSIPAQQPSESANSNIIIGTNDKQSDANKNKEIQELKNDLLSRKSQVESFYKQVVDRLKKVEKLEASLLSTTKACNQFEKLFQQELSARNKLESENDSLKQTINRLKAQISNHERNKFSNDELVRVLNATLMERDTEVSILKLKLTRLQTSSSSTAKLDLSLATPTKADPRHVFSSTGRSNSEFDRNSYVRSSMIAEAASVRASTSQLQPVDRDASVWATVPEELTPSRRPQMLENSFERIYGDRSNHYGNAVSLLNNHSSTPFTRERHYKTLPKSMKSPSQEFSENAENSAEKQASTIGNGDIDETSQCKITNLDCSNSTSHSNGNKTSDSHSDSKPQLASTSNASPATPDKPKPVNMKSRENFTKSSKGSLTAFDSSHYSTIADGLRASSGANGDPPSLPTRAPTTPIKISSGLKKIFGKFRRSDSSTNSQDKYDLTASVTSTPAASPFKRGANRSTVVGMPRDIRAHVSPTRQAMNFQTDKPFAEWDTDMLVDWLTMIGLSMYTMQCRRWVKCGAHIMNATPAEVDKGLGITNPLHRKKLRLAISELNGDCDKVTKAAAKLDYLWVARWLDDIGLPQYKESFINARVDGRVLNYLTVEDLVSMGVKSVLHHASIRCGIKVLRSIKFDLQLLKRRATSEEVEQMNSMRRQMNLEVNDKDSQSFDQAIVEASDVRLWTCHRVMEWLRLIDFAEFAPNLRGSGVHGGLIIFEDGFNIDTMCSLLSIPINRTLLRRHLSTFFKELIGKDIAQSKRQYQDLPSNQQLNPLAEIKTHKKSQWFSKLKSSKVGQDGMDEYLCPMYPIEPHIIKSPNRKNDLTTKLEEPHLSRIPESINV